MAHRCNLLSINEVRTEPCSAVRTFQIDAIATNHSNTSTEVVLRQSIIRREIGTLESADERHLPPHGFVQTQILGLGAPSLGVSRNARNYRRNS